VVRASGATACSDLSAFARPPVATLPWSPGRGSAPARSAVRTSVALRSGASDRTSAAIPLTIGALNDVPSAYSRSRALCVCVRQDRRTSST
jgi:hypothetical protein